MSWFKPSSRRTPALLIVLLVLGFSSSAAANDFLEPVDVTSTPENPYITNGAFTPGDGVLNGANFIADFSGITGTGRANATVLQKGRLENSFTESSIFAKTEVSEGLDNSQVPFSSSPINSFQLDAGQSNTFTCDSTEHTVKFYDAGSGSDPVDVTFAYDGVNHTINEGAFVDFDCDNSGSDTSPYSPDYVRPTGAVHFDSQADVSSFEVLKSPDLSNSYYEFRPQVKDPDDGGLGTLPGEIIKFSVGESGNNLPYPSWEYGICVEDKTCIKPGQSLSDVTPNSSISFKIREPNGDDVPREHIAALADNSNVNIDSNTIQLLLNALGISEPTDGTVITFDPNPCAGAVGSCTDDEDFLSKTDTTYSFHLSLMDDYEAARDGDSRDSLTVTLTTASSGNNIDSVSANSLECEVNNQWNSCDSYIYNSTYNVTRMRANVTYSNADILVVQFSVADRYDYPNDYRFHFRNYTSRSGDYFIYDIPSGSEFKFNESGEWNASVRAATTTGLTSWVNQSFNLSWGTPVVENLTVNGGSSDGVNVKRYRQMNVTADITCEGGECASQTNGTHDVAENVTVWLDPAGVERQKVDVEELSPGQRKVVTKIYRKETVLDKVLGWIGEVLT